MAKKRIVLCKFYIAMATSAQLWLFETGQLLASHAGILGELVDCKTVRIFAYSSTHEQSNKRSGTRLKTESETGERR